MNSACPPWSSAGVWTASHRIPWRAALSPNFVPGRNLLRALFLDPAERALHVDWDEVTAGVVGGLRQVAGGETADPRLGAIVADLCERSERFRELWTRAEIGYRPAGTSHMRHPEVGELLLQRNRFLIPDSGGLHLQIYHAIAGSDSADRLAQLSANPIGLGAGKYIRTVVRLICLKVPEGPAPDRVRFTK